MARKRDRAFALTMAVLFFITAFGFSFFVIWQQTHQNSSSSSPTTSTTGKSKLAGTKLANFTPVASVPNLQIIDKKVGTGATVKPGDTITVNYTGALASTGIIFQSSLDSGQPAQLSLSQVIAGWSQGIPGMKVGGTRRLLIPSALGYGPKAQTDPTTGQVTIPANSNLVFDVKVLKIN